LAFLYFIFRDFKSVRAQLEEHDFFVDGWTLC